MNRARLASLVAFMIMLQVFMVVAEAHAFEAYESLPSKHDVLHQASTDMHSDDDHTDSDEHDDAIDHVRHCSHHGCHCPLLLTGASSHAPISNLSSAQSRATDHIPDAPLSTLFRPPIV